MMERPWCRFRREARARERRRLPQVVDSLKVLDQNRPFREADVGPLSEYLSERLRCPVLAWGEHEAAGFHWRAWRRSSHMAARRPRAAGRASAADRRARGF